jgi:hypothetical protein
MSSLKQMLVWLAKRNLFLCSVSAKTGAAGSAKLLPHEHLNISSFVMSVMSTVREMVPIGRGGHVGV